MNIAMKDAIKLVFVNGKFDAALSDADALSANLKFAVEEFCYNTEVSMRQQNITVELRGQIKSTLHCLFVTNQENAINNFNINILMTEDSDASLLAEHITENSQSYSQSYLTNSIVNIHLNKNAKLKYYKIQNEGLGATHICSTMIKQLSDSHFTYYVITQGSKLARENITAHLQERNATCILRGFNNTLHNSQEHSVNVQANHLHSFTTSEMHYKGIADKKSRAIFSGKIYVEKNVQKISAEQANHNLLLSNEAEVSTKPEFEIYADDVKCKHGATVGQINDEALFYLRSRGIKKENAIELLKQAFATSIIERIGNQEIVNKIQHILKSESELMLC